MANLNDLTGTVINYFKFNAFEILFLLLANYAYKKIKLIEIFLKKEHENKKTFTKVVSLFFKFVRYLVLHRSKRQAEPTKRYHVEWAKQKLKANARKSYTN